MIIQCKECDRDKHVTALHPGPAPWVVRDRNVEHVKEAREENSPDIISKCTKVCGEANNSRSCSEICLVKVHLRKQTDRCMKVYAVLYDLINRSHFVFDLFYLKDTDSCCA